MYVLAWLVGLVLIAITPVAAQQAGEGQQQEGRERAARLLEQAIEARGGARYLNFKTLTASGLYTSFDRGSPTVPLAFLDTIVYPDKERTEFGRGKKKDRRIQVNVGSSGWIYDGEVETLKDQNEKQTRDFLEGLTYDLDRLLRGGWKEPGVSVRYAGREETRPGERAEVVGVKLANGREAFIWLDRTTHLPLSLTYEKEDHQGLSKHEVRFFQYVSYDGVKFPNIIDFLRDGVQLSRINYEKILLDQPVAEEIFAKPAHAKAIK